MIKSQSCGYQVELRDVPGYQCFTMMGEVGTKTGEVITVEELLLMTYFVGV